MDDAIEHGIILLVGENRIDGVRAHSTSVRTSVPVESALVILRSNHRLENSAVSKHVE